LNKTSIIILTHNKLEYTQMCLDSIRRYTPRHMYELIVVDNASTDGTREYLAEQTDVLTMFNEENVGFPKGCNQGIELARGDSILLLNNDVIVTENWLPLLLECLYSSEEIGAVGPVTNSAGAYQSIQVGYGSIEEMLEFANRHNRHDPAKWEERLKLIGFCLLMKRDAVEKVGPLDERFSPGFCEDTDYSVRLIKAGYKLYLCRNVFVHHFGSASFNEMPEFSRNLLVSSRQKFLEKWGFHSVHHMDTRHDLISMMGETVPGKPLRVLDVGCGAGGTLLRLKYLYPDAELYGVERNPEAAEVASRFARVSVGEMETLEFPDQFFDYVFFSGVMEQIRHPEEFLSNFKRVLKPGGRIVADVSNAMYYGVIWNLLHGKVRKEEPGTLSRNIASLYTLEEIQRLFRNTGFQNVTISAVKTPANETVEQWIGELGRLANFPDLDQYRTSQYLVSAQIVPETRDLGQILQEMAVGTTRRQLAEQLAERIRRGFLSHEQIIRTAEEVVPVDLRPELYNFLASHFYQANLFDHIIPLLQASLQIAPRHANTLYNFAYILHKVGANDKALFFLNQMEDKDEEALRLLEEITMKLPQ